MKRFLGMIIAALVLAIAAILAYSHFILDKQPDTVIVDRPSGDEQSIVDLENAQSNAEIMIKNLVDGVVGEQDIKVVYKGAK